MNEQKTVNNKKIPFKEYYQNMTTEQRVEFMKVTKPYISNSHMYTLLKRGWFTKLQQFYLESITNMKFDWNE